MEELKGASTLHRAPGGRSGAVARYYKGRGLGLRRDSIQTLHHCIELASFSAATRLPLDTGHT